MNLTTYLARLFTVSFGILGFALMTGAWAQTFDDGLGKLKSILPDTGQEDNWRYVKGDNTFEIENIGDPNVITYYYVNAQPGTEGQRSIETAVSIHPDSKGSAGLIYGLDKQRGIYHMLTLNASGTVTFYRRNEQGFRPLLEQSGSAFVPGKMNILRIDEKGDEIFFSLNGTSMGSLGGDLFGFGSVGLAAVGDVRAIFNMFSDDAASGRQSDLRNPASDRNDSTIQKADASLQLLPLQIMDQSGPAGQPIVAYQTMIPADWKDRGGVSWNANDGQGQCFTGARLIWGAMSADEAYSVSYLDPISWGVTSVGPAKYRCLQADLPNAQSVMQQYMELISRSLQAQNISVTVQEYFQPPDLKPLVDVFSKGWRVNVPGAQTWVDAVAIKTEVVTPQQTLDGLVVAVTKHMSFDGSAGSFRSGQTGMVVGFTTPQGKMNQGHPGIAAILNNLRPNPQWLQLEAQWWQQKKAELGGVITAQTSSAYSSGKSIGDSMFESWQRRQRSEDSGFEKTINGIWEVEPWKTTEGETMLLDQNYKYAWKLSNGSIVQTNDANFSPVAAYNQTGQQMQQDF